MSTSFMRTDVKERERERERKREEKYATEKTKLFLRLLRLRKTEIITALSDSLPTCFHHHRLSRAKKETKEKWHEDAHLAHMLRSIREGKSFVSNFSSEHSFVHLFVITSPPQNTSNRGRVISLPIFIITIIAE